MKVSEEVAKLNGKEGSSPNPLIDLVKQYLDIKKVNYSILKAEPGDNVARPEGVNSFVEPGSIMIEKDGKKVIIEELTKVCGGSGRYHAREKNVKIDSILDRISRIVFKTSRDIKGLHIYIETEIKDPSFGSYLGGGNISVDIDDILKEPSNIPEYSETFEVRCKCEEGILKCTGYAWQW